MRMPRIGVLSEQELYRDGIVEILRQHGFRRVEGFANSAALLRGARVAPLDLALVDLAHEQENFEEIARRLRTEWSNMTLVAIGTRLQLAARAQDVDGCVELPTDGAARLQAMAEAVARSHHGPIKFALSPEVAQQRLTWASLTPRQRQVLGLLGCGMENSKIAASLGISERAIKAHVSALLEKFHASNRTELALIACRAGLEPA
jgi:two-component system, NarL family, nitrate/nitrite response regulator NarL